MTVSVRRREQSRRRDGRVRPAEPLCNLRPCVSAPRPPHHTPTGSAASLQLGSTAADPAELLLSFYNFLLFLHFFLLHLFHFFSWLISNRDQC